MKYAPIRNFRAGQWPEHEGEWLDVVSPVDGTLLSRVPLSTAAELAAAVQCAAAAFQGWSRRTLRQRAEIFYRYRTLLEEHREELSQLIHEENGKTPAEGEAEVDKAIEVVEFACAMPSLSTGEVLEVSPDVECRIDHTPLGVVASITPFNFPLMVPHWTIPIALVAGNTMILKPSEKVPLTAQRFAALLQQAGIPDGVFQVIHGDGRLVELLCDEPRVAAVSFVGSTPIAKKVYARGTAQMKRVLAMGGAKNHLVVLPDADPQLTTANVVASMAGCAGQRCMAAAALIAIGNVQPLIESICAEARRMVPGENLGAVISHEAKQRIERYITEAEQAGARVLVDGRHTTVAGKEQGSYVGATVVDGVTPEMRIAHEEVFGPVLAILRAGNLEEAIQIENRSPYGNAAAIYTRDGGAARHFIERASAGMIGVNVGVPVPREPFGFGGWNDSRFGVGDVTGKGSLGFWTQSRKVTTRWT